MAESDNLQEARNDALRFTNDSIELEEIDGRERARRGRNGHPFGARPCLPRRWRVTAGLSRFFVVSSP